MCAHQSTQMIQRFPGCARLLPVGFTTAKLASIDGALDEMALLLQHTESYDRFVRHIVEVRAD